MTVSFFKGMDGVEIERQIGIGRGLGKSNFSAIIDVHMRYSGFKFVEGKLLAIHGYFSKIGAFLDGLF